MILPIIGYGETVLRKVGEENTRNQNLVFSIDLLKLKQNC